RQDRAPRLLARACRTPRARSGARTPMRCDRASAGAPRLHKAAASRLASPQLRARHLRTRIPAGRRGSAKSPLRAARELVGLDQSFLVLAPSDRANAEDKTLGLGGGCRSWAIGRAGPDVKGNDREKAEVCAVLRHERVPRGVADENHAG